MGVLTPILLLPLLLVLYVAWTFLALTVRQLRSPLRLLPGPRSRSFFMGNLRELHDAENTGLLARWERAHGRTFVYRGFVGGCRLMTTDPVAVAHILGRGYEFPKPDFVRDALASMAAGHDGLITVEGEQHRKQRKILSPAFTSTHIKSLSPVFWEKALKLRDIWLDIVDAGISTSPSTAPADPFSPPEPLSTSPEGSSTGFVRWVPNPFASFVGSKATRVAAAPLPEATSLVAEDEKARDEEARGVKMDVLAWLARATLDVIGEAGFGYVFNSLNDGGGGEEENELARAFGVIFSTARKFRVITILQVWFPVLRKFRRNSTTEDAARATMHRIGSQLIDERLQQITADGGGEKEFLSDEMDGRDLLSVLLRSSLAEDPSQQLSRDEILCQISTFIAAGHETSSSALAWTLYALARAPHVQAKLRASLLALRLELPSDGDAEATQAVLAHTYLDACVREALRLYAPVTNTMRVAASDAAVPVSRPFVDAHGRTCSAIALRAGDIVTVPLQAMNRSADVWGEDAEAFVPERFLKGGCAQGEGEDGEGKDGGLRGLWGGILTFGSGAVVDGNRSCIGYRFAINEIKIFLYVLLTEFEFSMDPGIEIEKRINVVTRPWVKSEPHMGNQMPLRLRRVQPVSPSEVV
ncbi:cytochrome P450 [Trametopsis cervina]|nr:cytochrome P450 [Trametopsis cervina]